MEIITGLRQSPLMAVTCLAVFWTSGAAIALEPIDLGDRSTLTVSADDAARTVTVMLANDGALQESVTLGNAEVKPDAVKTYKFCSTCTPAYFVPVSDRTSTYGATTGIVIWHGGWWTLAVLPLSVAGVAGPDKHGVYWLTDTTELNGRVTVDRYWFDDGLLKPR